MAKKKVAASTQENLLRHPRDTLRLIGQEEAERQLLQAWNSGRMPHAWLISGPKGIGKASLAYRFARFLLTGGRAAAESLEVDMALPAARRVQQSSHADLLVIENVEGAEIVADEARALGEFLSLTPAESAWRVVIVDSVDAMNRNAANAILKTLEEPPARAALLLVSHNPGMLLPTIRSRCRVLKLKPLSGEHFAHIVQEHAVGSDAETRRAYYLLSGGSAGIALFLMEQEALALYHALLELFPLGKSKPDWMRAHRLAEQLAAKQDTARFEALQHVLQYLFHQLIRLSRMGEATETELLEGENTVLAYLASFKTTGQWLDLWQETALLLQDVKRIHLDRKQVLLNIISAMQPGGRIG